jgi:hypothetical protein
VIQMKEIAYQTIVGCVVHSDFQSERDLFGINENDSAMKSARVYMAKCQEKFQMENPCPKCKSHNTDIDWGTPMFCRDCGYEWLPQSKDGL